MNNALEISGLKKVYKGGFTALKGIDLTVKQGDFFALLGPNGAGKSTLISIICSLVKKSAGSVSILGFDIDTQFTEARRELGVVPQEFNFNGFESVEDIIINQAGYYGIPRGIAAKNCEKYLKKLGLWEKRHQASRFLSGGMKRRLMIARALVHEPSLLVLDEPTAGVDIELRRSMWSFLEEVNAAGTTIILTTHYLEEAEQLCRNIAILDHGELLLSSTMPALLGQLKRETFVFDIASSNAVPESLDGYRLESSSSEHLEVTLVKGQNLSELFDLLKSLNVVVHSMRNKANRLEELFVGLVQASEGV